MAEGSAVEVVGVEDPDDHKSESLRLKALSKEKYDASDIESALELAEKAHGLCPSLDGIFQMVTALRIISSPSTDHYLTLQLEPFSHSNAIRRQYKFLALLLHPDKSSSSNFSFGGAEEAFKRVAEAFRVLSDKVKKKEYDIKIRVELERAGGEGERVDLVVETFWTACETCRVFHEFDRRYLGQRLLCPGCRKSFVAVEVKVDDVDVEYGDIDSSGSGEDSSSDSDSEGIPKVGEKNGSRTANVSEPRSSSRLKSPRKKQVGASGKDGNLNTKKKIPKDITLAQMLQEMLPREMTLAEMQKEALSMKSKSNLYKVDENGSKRRRKCSEDKEDEDEEENGWSGMTADPESVMAVEDSDFYNFDNDRTEKCFKKGDVWAVYDDDDMMPRHYGLIDDVVATKPFKLKMYWLDLKQESSVPREETGFLVSCGNFKVGKKVIMDAVNLFSHVVSCERAARELYRIYPKKGSVWALYSERTANGGKGRCYDAVLVLTTYTEAYGLSMGYLEKVSGFKTIFQRKEVGAHAIRIVEKDELRLFSHQIPARKVSGEDGLALPEDCWELDPASLSSELLCITRGG